MQVCLTAIRGVEISRSRRESALAPSNRPTRPHDPWARFAGVFRAARSMIQLPCLSLQIY